MDLPQGMAGMDSLAQTRAITTAPTYLVHTHMQHTVSMFTAENSASLDVIVLGAGLSPTAICVVKDY